VTVCATEQSENIPTPSYLSSSSCSLSHILLSAHRLHKRNNPNKHTNLPARTKPSRTTSSTRRCLLILAERRFQLQTSGHIARLAKVRVRVDFIGNASRPVGEVFGVGFAPVVAARGVGLHGAFAAASGHFLDQIGVRDGDGAHEVGLGLVDVAETGDPGGGADGVGHAADWREEN
jgi:hypothetical protein